MLSNETKGLDILNKKSYRRIINATYKKSINESINSADLESGIPVKNANNLKICW